MTETPNGVPSLTAELQNLYVSLRNHESIPFSVENARTLEIIRKTAPLRAVVRRLGVPTVRDICLVMYSEEIRSGDVRYRAVWNALKSLRRLGIVELHRDNHNVWHARDTGLVI